MKTITTYQGSNALHLHLHHDQLEILATVSFDPDDDDAVTASFLSRNRPRAGSLFEEFFLSRLQDYLNDTGQDWSSRLAEQWERSNLLAEIIEQDLFTHYFAEDRLKHRIGLFYQTRCWNGRTSLAIGFFEEKLEEILQEPIESGLFDGVNFGQFEDRIRGLKPFRFETRGFVFEEIEATPQENASRLCRFIRDMRENLDSEDFESLLSVIPETYGEGPAHLIQADTEVRRAENALEEAQDEFSAVFHSYTNPGNY